VPHCRTATRPSASPSRAKLMPSTGSGSSGGTSSTGSSTDQLPSGWPAADTSKANGSSLPELCRGRRRERRGLGWPLPRLLCASFAASMLAVRPMSSIGGLQGAFQRRPCRSSARLPLPAHRTGTNSPCQGCTSHIAAWHLHEGTGTAQPAVIDCPPPRAPCVRQCPLRAASTHHPPAPATIQTAAA
jgi:hypothetical protein